MNIGSRIRRLGSPLFVAAVLLTGCGGGDVEYEATFPILLVTQTTTSNGNPGGPSGGITLMINGPAFTTTKPASVQVCRSGAWVQKVSRPVFLSLKHSITQPIQGVPVTSPSTSASSTQDGTIAIDQCSQFLVPNAGSYQLQMMVELTSDCACADALGSYAAKVNWVVRAQYTGI